MRRLLLVTFVAMGALALLPAAPAFAAESVEKLTVALVLQGDGSLRVKETVVYDFGDAKRHGIFRDIPLETDGAEVTGVSVTRNGSPEPVDFENTGSWLRVRIGSPDVKVSGSHTYVISYVAQRPLAPVRDRPGVLALSWDAIGDGWDVPIRQSAVVVSTKLPFQSIKCVRGPRGAREACVRRGSASFSTGALRSGEGVTIFAPLKPGHGMDLPPAEDAWEWEPGLPPTAPLLPPEEFPVLPDASSSSTSGRLGAGMAGFLGCLLAGAAAGVTGAFLLRRRRVSAPVQYEPPRRLTPLQLGVALYSGALPAPATIAGALLDLAQRKWVAVALAEDEVPQVTWLGSGSGALSDAEQALAGAVLQGQAGPVRVTPEYLLGQQSALRQVQRIAAASVPISRHPRPQQLRTWWALGAALVVALSVGAMVSGLGVLGAVLFGAAASMLATVGVVRRQESVDEAVFSAEVEGFRRLLSTDAAELRHAYAERTGYDPAALAATLLPYAVVLLVPGQWLEAFPDLDRVQLEKVSGVYGLARVGSRGLAGLTYATGQAMRRREPARSSGMSFGGSGSTRFTGVRRGAGFSGGRGFSGSRGASFRSSGMGRRGGGRGGGGGGSW